MIKEYSAYPREDLISSIRRISKRLGGDNTAEALKEVEEGNFRRAIEITLSYYDKTYMFGLKKRAEDMVSYIETERDEIPQNAESILAEAARLFK
jgi:tRNA 2-selenouridine synthase